MGGFSYRGRNIGSFGEIYYIPDESERGEYALPYDVYEQEITGRDGAYYYGNRVEAREFTLKCYYEELTQETKEDIMRWFGRNTKGQLIFDDRKYVYYDVIPNARIEFNDYRSMTCLGLRYKGIMTIRLKAYCPFGKMVPGHIVNACPMIGINAYVDISRLGEIRLLADDETLVLTIDRMPGAPYDLTQTEFLVYNPGTEPTPLLLKMQGTSGTGTSEKGTIKNESNGTTCTITGMTPGRTSDVGKTLVVNSDTGRVTLEGALDTQQAFNMHDEGYIWLDPCTPFVRAIFVQYEEDSTTVTSSSVFTEEMVGQYIYVGGLWRKIVSRTDSHTIEVNTAIDSTGDELTQIVTMNVIKFTDIALSHLEMSYTPRVR